MARKAWLDAKGESTLIDDYAQQTSSFIEAMADGKIVAEEVSAQEAKLVELMKQIEPKLDDDQHAEITDASEGKVRFVNQTLGSVANVSLCFAKGLFGRVVTT